MPGWKLDPSPETKQKVIRGNKRSTSGWFAAVERGEEERMKQLLAGGHDVNQQDSQCRWAAIYYAAWKNRTWQAELLLESGADLTLESNEGDTAIHVAARYGHAEMLRLLLRSAVVSSKNEFGKTPLDLARQKNHWGSVAALEEAYGLPLSLEVTDPPSPLPKNWLDGDYGNGQKFYYNPFSGETSETRPAAP